MHRNVRAAVCAMSLLSATALPAFAAPSPAAPATTVVASPAQEEPDEAGDGSVRTLIKAVSYQTFSSLNDFAFGYFFGGGLLAGGLLVAANALSETAVTFVHDKLWAEAVGDTPQAEEETRNSRTATYTSINLVRTFMMGRVVAGSALIGGIYMALNAVNDAMVYAGNDMIFATVWPAGTPAPEWSRFVPFLAAADRGGDLVPVGQDKPALPMPKR